MADAGAPEVWAPAIATGTLTAVGGTTEGGADDATGCKVCGIVGVTGYPAGATAGMTVTPAPKVAATELTAEGNYVGCGDTD